MLFKKAALLLLVSVCSLYSRAQTADQVISNYVLFLGGEDHWKSVKTIITSGTYNYGGIEFPFTAYSKAPNQYKFVVPFKGKYYAQAFDGNKGWKIDAFKNETKKTYLTGKAARSLANEADVELESPFIDYQEKGHHALLEGVDTVDAVPCYKIKFTRSTGEEETYFFSTNNYALIKKQAVSKNQEMENSLLDTYYSDYRQINGVKIPYKLTSKTGEQTILTITVSDARLNAAISASEFK